MPSEEAGTADYGDIHLERRGEKQIFPDQSAPEWIIQILEIQNV